MTVETIVRITPTVQALHRAFKAAEATADPKYFLRSTPEQLVTAAAYDGAARCLWREIVSSVCTQDDKPFEKQVFLTDAQIDDMMRVADLDKIWIRIRFDVLCEGIMSLQAHPEELRAQLEHMVVQMAYDAGVPSLAENITASRTA